MLDCLRHTATGLDALPAWFLKLGAPAFYKPIARFYSLSTASSTVPQQCKTASIKPIPKVIPKVTTPKQLADYRPISVTPVLTRVMERSAVTNYLYPCFLSQPPSLSFTDQYAFSAHRITNSGYNLSPSHNLPPPHYQSLCCCNLP